MTRLKFAHREPIGSSTYPMPDGPPDLVRTGTRLGSADAAGRIVNVYVHIPFCDQICSFCGFNKFVSGEDVKERYVRSLLAEIRAYATTPWVDSAKVSAVYLGGGTPNSLSPDQLSRILTALHAELHLADDCEITCEGTPMNFTDDRNQALRQHGVRRVSAGIQTFDRDIRETHLHMREGKQELLECVATIADAFDDFNLDLIFNLPRQTDEIWVDDLATALATPATHLTVYPLVLLENTIFYTDFVKRGAHPAPDQGREITLFEWTESRLADTPYGAGRYTVRDWALPGKACRYIDLNARGAYVLAFGAGAHGYIAGYTYRNVKNVAKYVAAVDSGFPLDGQHFCDQRAEMDRFMVMALRRLSVDLADFSHRFGVDARELYRKTFDDLADSGYVTLEGTTVRYTDSGMTWANNIRSLFETRGGKAVGYSDTTAIGQSGKDHHGSITRVKATDAETA